MLNSLRSRILILLVSVLIVTTVVFIILYQRATRETMTESIENTAKNVLHLVMLNIQNQYNHLMFYKISMLDNRKKELKDLLLIQKSNIKNLYDMTVKGLIDEEKAKQQILENMRSIKYGNHDYIWISDYDSVLISHPDPKLNGTDFSKQKDIKGNLIVPPMVEIAREKGQGFYSYWWKRLDSAKHIKKIAYFVHFPEWEWVIGTGLYVDDIEEESKKMLQGILEEIKETFTRIKFIQTSYLFLFDGNKDMLVHPYLEGKNLSKIINSVTKKYIGDELIEASKYPDKPFHYLWDKPGHEKNYKYWKQAYVKYFEPLDWYVVFSVYKDEMTEPAAILLRKIIFTTIICLIILFILSALFASSLTKPIRNLIAIMNEVIEKGLTSVKAPVRGARESRELVDIFNKMLDNLQKYDQLKDDFLANTSHELRTPLNGIIGLSESLLAGIGGDLTSEQEKNIKMIILSGKRLSNLVNDILDFSKLKHHEIQLQLKPVDIKSVTDLVVALSQHLINQKKIRLINNISQNTLQIQADESRLEQILYNIIGNAIKFTHEGKIEVTAKKENDYIVISVSDTGIGIDKDKQKIIFRSFEQGDGSIARQYSGTGLGLAVTRQLVELQGGNIWVESEPGRGSIFSFKLPVSKEQNKFIPGMPERKRIQRIYNKELSSDNNLELKIFDSKNNTKEYQNIKNVQIHENENNENEAKTILIVDDEPINIQVLKNQLNLQNYNILVAYDGFQALELIKVKQPDLIILDLMMPVMNGYEVCQIVRKQYNAATIPIIILTGKNQITDLIKGFNIGANDYLTKPFDKEELIARIETQLNLKYLVAENVRLNAKLDVARLLQKMVLPRLEELDQIKDLDISCFMEPADIIAGDYYDILQNNDKLKIGIGDVSGHGLESGIFMVMVQTAIRTLVTHGENDPARLLQTVNKTMYDNEIRMQFNKSLSLSLIDYKSRQFNVSGQHEDIIIVRKKGDIELFKTDDLGFPLALESTISDFISEQKITLKPGECIILFTDGITEAENTSNEFYGIDRLCNVISRVWKESSEEIKKAVIEDVFNFIGSQQVYDDITLLVIKQK